jgi:MoaA/NifB/PqqE/SkfB family radical SAM enzyme
MGKITPYIKYVKHLWDRCIPISVQLNITNKCGCRCLMCGKHTWGLGSMEQSKLISLIEEFKESGVESVVFSGGDPLVYPNFQEIVKFCGNHLKVGILTAGNVPFKHWNEIIQKVKWIRFSVDAADVEVWKKIRGSTDVGFHHLLENLKTISELIPDSEKKNKVRLNFCKLKGINEDQEEKTKEMAEQFGFDFMAHETRVVKEYMNKEEHHDHLNKECIIPLIHCVIEANGMVFPCCDIMNENAKWDEVNTEYRLGDLNHFSWNFFSLWFSQKATAQKLFFVKNRVKECETCPTRYYPANIEFENKKDETIFL